MANLKRYTVWLKTGFYIVDALDMVDAEDWATDNFSWSGWEYVEKAKTSDVDRYLSGGYKILIGWDYEAPCPI